MYKFSKNSKGKLSTVHSDLQILMEVVLRTNMFDLTVIEGIRSDRRQKMLLDRGITKTLKSKHLTGHAVDIGIHKGGKLDFDDTRAYYVLAGTILLEAKRLGISVRWGGNWDSDQNFDDQSFNDLVHWELLT